MPLIGLVLVGLLFTAGALFSLPKTEFYLATAGVIAVGYWPLFIIIQRELNPNYKFRDGFREYAATLVFVMIFVALIFSGTQDYLNNAVSELIKDNSGF